jgi:hypothetical protein
MAKKNIYRITEDSPDELREAYEELRKRTRQRNSMVSDELTKCINEFLYSPLRRIEDLESLLRAEQDKSRLSETLRNIERTTAEHKIAKLEERIMNLTESLDLLNAKLERMESVSVVAHKQGTKSLDTPPSVH